MDVWIKNDFIWNDCAKELEMCMNSELKGLKKLINLEKIHEFIYDVVGDVFFKNEKKVLGLVEFAN